MAQIISIYVGKASETNLHHGLVNGIWGFKKSVSKNLETGFILDEESYILLGSGYSGGSPRVDKTEWVKYNLSNLYFAKITSNIFNDTNQEWDDENKMDINDRYSVRIRFDKSSLLKYSNIPLSSLNNEIAESLRSSAIAQSRGYLNSNIDIAILKNSLANFLTPINQNKIKPNKQIFSIKEIIEHTQDFIECNGFQYQKEEIANFYLALRAKPFVILAGISGTGKTQLPRKFAAALGFSKEQVIQLPVRPDWTDSSDLLGYTSLDGNFIPKDLTLAIQKATANPDKPFFFILDEMNLARVEHYFSDYLSVIETRERVGKDIKTDPILREEILKAAKNISDFTEMGLPQNLYLIGTVNMDETTHAFSKKVLDRANSIEMNDVDLNWIENNGKSIEKLSNISNELFKTVYVNSSELNEADKKSITDEMRTLQAINKILEKADLHFAYRVRDEIAFYLIINKKYELINSSTAFDFQVVQKILPRIHGSSERVQTVLVELLNLLEGKNFRSSNFEFSMLSEKIEMGSLKYKRASKKIIFMLKRFDEDRFTSFWL